MSQEIQGMLVRIEATTAQLRREMDSADRAVAGATRNIDGQLLRADKAFDRLNQNSSKSLGGVGKSFDLLSLSVKAATAAMAALGVGASLTRFISNTQDAEKEQAQLAAVLRSTGEAAGYSGDQLNAMGEKLARSTTYTTGTITTAQTAMLAFTGVVGEEFTRAMDSAADMSARTGMSMAQTAETIGRALDVPSQGMAALSRQGFRFSDDQKALMKQLEATGKTAEAQGIILDALEESYGGAAAAARNTLGGALDALRNSFDLLLTGSGSALTGVTSAVNALNTALSGDGARKAIIALGDALIVVSTIMAGRVVSAGYASAAAFLAAQVQAIRYQAALATMAGVSSKAAMGMAVASSAARAVSGAMALIGGPVGAAVIAASAITYFATSASKAERDADELDARIQKLGDSFGSLNAAQAAAAILDYQTKMEAAELAVAAAENRVISLTNNIRSINDEKAVERWEKELVVARGAAADADVVVAGLKEKIAQLTAIIDQNTASQNANNAAVAGVGAAAEKYIDSINKRTAAIQDGNDPIKQANRHIQEHGQYTEEEAAAILKAAQANKSAIDAQKSVTDATKLATSAIKTHTKEIDALIAKYNPAEKAQADYEKAVKLADDALKNNNITTKQYQNTIQGLYKDLNKPMWDKHNKAAKEAADAIKKIDDQLESIRDRFDPLNAATRKLTEEKKLLKTALDRGRISLEEYQQRLGQLNEEYAKTARATSQWAQWTDSALERVDSAFADAWRNIGDGFKGFRDNLTNAFKQMLAELAHMAITRPIIMQIGAAMGIGGGAGQISSMLGGGSGGMSLGQIANYGQSIYSALTGVGPAALAGYQAGGLWGGVQGVGSYYSGMLGNAYSTATGWLGGGAVQGGAGVMLDASGNIVNYGVQNAASSVAGYAPWFAGAAGAYMGYQQSGLKGAATGAAGGYFGAQGGAALGSFAGPVGTVVGAILGGVAGAILGSNVFGGKWQTKDGGLGFSINDGDFLGQEYEFQKKKGGLFRSNKKRTNWMDLDPDSEMAQVLQQTYDATEVGVKSLYESLGFSIEESALDGLQLARQQISTQGKTAEEISAAIGEWFSTAAEAMNTELGKLFDTGLDYDLAGMQQFVGNMLAVNEVLRYLDVGMYEASVAGGKLAESLSAAAGGIEMLATNAATYYGAFFTDAEKTEDTIDAITRAFAAADITLVDSREAYRKMVEDIDHTTEAGQQMFATLMGLAGQAAQYFSIVEQQAAEAIAAAQATAAQSLGSAISTANSAYSTLQRSITAERKRLTAEFNAAAQAEAAASQRASAAASAASSARASALTASASVSQELVRMLLDLDRAMSSAMDRLLSTNAAVVAMRREQSISLLHDALSIARNGGSLAGIEGLSGALDAASVINADSYNSLEDLQREQGRTASLIAGLQKLNGNQLTVEEEILDRLNKQLESARASQSSVSSGFSGVSSHLQAQYDADIAALDEELAAAELQMDAMNGIDNSILSVQAAIDQMSAAVVAAIHAQEKYKVGDGSVTPPASSSATSGAVGLEATIKRMYESTLGYTADSQGVKFWTERLQGGESLSSLQQALNVAAAQAALPKIPAFATGGEHYGGLRLVGENGPELEVTGPSRIHSASQTAAMLSGGDTAAAVQDLRRSVDAQTAALRSIAKHTQQTARRVEFIERWDYDGMPEERAAI